jgi:hypothetical protein
MTIEGPADVVYEGPALTAIRAMSSLPEVATAKLKVAPAFGTVELIP